jgi:hypothetical protein
MPKRPNGETGWGRAMAVLCGSLPNSVRIKN